MSVYSVAFRILSNGTVHSELMASMSEHDVRRNIRLKYNSVDILDVRLEPNRSLLEGAIYDKQ